MTAPDNPAPPVAVAGVEARARGVVLDWQEYQAQGRGEKTLVDFIAMALFQAATAARSQGRDEEREEIVAWHRREIAGDEKQIEENNAYRTRNGFTATSEANEACRVSIRHHELAIRAIERGDHRSRSEAPNDSE